MNNNSQEIDQLFEQYVEQENFSGVGLIKQGAEVRFQRAYGLAHRGWKIPNQIDTRFDTASITKLFTATAILQLVDQGRLSLDDRVLELIDIGETTISNDVTIFHLLTHTSGIADDADEEAGESYEEIWKNRPNYSVRETADYLAQFKSKKPIFRPGEGCRYNNCAFILLGLVIEKISGEPYRSYVKKNIFNALGMHQTDFYAMDQVAERVAEHYVSITDDEEKIIGFRKNIYSYPPIGSADAGALTTVHDLDLFIRSLRAGKLLSETSTEAFFKPKVLYRKHEKVSKMMGYGTQFLIRNDTNEIIYVQKDGLNAGVSCLVNYYPEHDLTMIILSNHNSNVWDLARDIQKSVLGDVLK